MVPPISLLTLTAPPPRVPPLSRKEENSAAPLKNDEDGAEEDSSWDASDAFRFRSCCGRCCSWGEKNREDERPDVEEAGDDVAETG